MKKYTVKIAQLQTHILTFFVEAENEDDAKEQVLSGQVDIAEDDVTDSEDLSEEITIEEEEK